MSPLISPRSFGKMMLPEEGLEASGEGRNAHTCRACALVKAQHRAELHMLRDHFSQLMRLKQSVDAKAAQYKVQLRELEAQQLQQQLQLLEQSESMANSSRQIERLVAHECRATEQAEAAEDRLKTVENEYHAFRVEAARDREELRRDLVDEREQEVSKRRETEAAADVAHKTLADKEEEVLSLQAEVDSLSVQLMQLKVEEGRRKEHGDQEMRAYALVYDEKCQRLLEREQELVQRYQQHQDWGAELEQRAAMLESEKHQALRRVAELEEQFLQEKLELVRQCDELRATVARDSEEKAELQQRLAQEQDLSRGAIESLEREVLVERERASAREFARQSVARSVTAMLRLLGEAREETTALIHRANSTLEDFRRRQVRS